MVKPEDMFPISKLVGTAEVELAQVPKHKYERKIYAIILIELSGSANTLELKEYDSDGTTLLDSWTFPLAANEIKPIISRADSPILHIKAGHYLKAVASADSVKLILNCYDL